MRKFEGNDFAIQLMSKGSFVDNGTGNDNSFLIEAFTIRLNHVALNAWILSETFSCRECYDTDKEWEDHKSEYKAKREFWNKQIIKALEIDLEAGSVSITQSLSEVFTVVHIRKTVRK
jgi:hypothetical protein